MTETDELRRRLQRANRELRGEARSAAIEGLIEEIDEQSEPALLVSALQDLVSSYEFSADPTRLIVPFARALALYDAAPEDFGPAAVHRVYWQHKWVVYKLLDHPDVPLASIEEWLGQMRERYAEAGHSLHPVHEAEYWVARHIGDEDRAERAAAAVAATEPDRMSDCEACRCANAGQIAANAGEFERALDLWEPVLGGRLRCNHQPHGTLAESVLPLAALGRLDQARANHLRGYQLARGKDDMVEFVAEHLRFCAITGNEPRALEILAASTRAFDLGLSPDVRRSVLEAVQVLCDALLRRGMDDTEVPGPENRTWTAAALREHADADRRALCERYDARNGTDAQTRLSAERVEPPIQYPRVPLGLKTLPEAPTVVEAAPEPTGDDALAAALDAARTASAAFADDENDRWALVDRLATALGAELDAADEAEVLLSRIDGADGPASALDLSATARERFEAAGLHGRSLTNRAAVLMWRFSTDPEAVPEAAREVIADAAAMEDDPVHALRANALAHVALLAHCQVTGTEPDADLRKAVAAADDALAERPGERRHTHARFALANALAAFATEPEARTEALRRRFDLAVAGDHPLETVAAAVDHSSDLNGHGRYEEAVAAAETGLAALVPGVPPFPVAALHLSITECSLNLGDRAKAEAHGVQAAFHYDLAGEPGCAAVSRHLLAKAVLAEGRHAEAVAYGESALADLPSMPAEEHWRLVDARVVLAEALGALGEARAGVEHALEALRLMDDGQAHPSAICYAQTAHLAGTLLARLGERDEARLAYRRAETAWRELGALPAAANSVRAALWTDLADEEGRESATAGMTDLAEELRADWANGDYPERYRAECRIELVRTLMQHGSVLAPDTEATLPHRRRLAEEAHAVVLDGEPLPQFDAQVTSRIMACLQEAGEPDADWEAAGAAVLERLDPDTDAKLRQSIERQLERMRDAEK
ncbi:hypothetical protein [Glycomyces paridis]|uniref:Tetratricopeptide repeat protein n=1 Tax=Glycomyces paridis TaxID=2126555 RepID=A0A4S8P7B8_9ACTN|nr:hypothetical protein [Glycomyces paridis]THV23599.1 hypothetical protein E9998_22660 [Glycomyces paridis]